MGIARATGAPGNTSCLVGTPEQIAAAVLEYYRLGIHSFLLRGFENPQDTVAIGRDLIPLIKAGADANRPAGRGRGVALRIRICKHREVPAHSTAQGSNCMKAVVVENYDSIDGISIKEMPLPGIAAGQVRVKIGAAAVGFVDGLKVQGLYQTKDPLPFVPGTEFAGIVDAAADDVTAFKPGMPVIGMTRSGALAEYISVPSAALKDLPPKVPFEAGASFQANYLTGLYALAHAPNFARAKPCWCWAPPAASASRPCSSASSWARGSSRRPRPRRSATSRCDTARMIPSTTPSRIGATR